MRKFDSRFGPIPTRREFLRTAGATAAAYVAVACGLPSAAKENTLSDKPSKYKFNLGVASYSFRTFDLEKTLNMTKRLGLKYIAFKPDFHLPLNSSPEKIAEVMDMVKKAGLELYGGGVIYMNNEAEVNRAFDYAKAAGMKVIIGAPKHDLLPLIDQKVKQYDIKVAIHNHGPGDNLYLTPESVYEKIKDLDRRIGICNDVGHTMRAGVDPSISVERFPDRLFDVHFKDVTAANAKGQTIEVGRGVIDIPKFVRALVKINYAGVAAFEYEKDVDDPLPGLAESVGYVRGVLASV
jgi:sugar phosphate isomerase/epimerase